MSTALAHADLVIDKKQYVTITRAIEMVRSKAVVAGRETIKQMGENFAQDIRARYAQGPGEPLKAGTLQKRHQGKRAGATPAIPPYPGSTPLKRSGTLIRLVRTRHTKGKDTATYAVFIRAGVPMPHSGGVSDRVAAVHEFGTTFSMEAPHRARVYLRALALGVANTDKAVYGTGSGPISITITIPARPVWVPAFDALLKRQPGEFVRIFMQRLQAHTGLKMVYSIQ